MKNNNKYIIFSAVLTILFANESAADNYPDSTKMNFDSLIVIQHTTTGEKVGSNPLLRTDYGEWSPWETSSHMTNCTPWTPHTDTVLWGEQFIQTNLCDAEETRERTITYYYTDGTVTTKVEYERTYTQVDDEQYAIGTKNYILSTTPEYGSWTTKGSTYSCSSWSPSTSTVKKGVTFNQQRSCKQDENRTVNYYDNWADGSKTHKKTTTESRTVSVTENRTAVGTKADAKWQVIYSGKTYSFNKTLPSTTEKFRVSISNNAAYTTEYSAKSSFSNKRFEDTDDNYGMGDECQFEASNYGYLSFNSSSKKLSFTGDGEEIHCRPDGFVYPEVALYKVEAYY